jgi:uncharacterized membrane protein
VWAGRLLPSSRPTSTDVGAEHHHRGEPALPSPPAVRRAIVAVLVPLVLATVAGLVLLWPTEPGPSVVGAERVDATIVDVYPCADVAEPEQATPDVELPTEECLEALVTVDAGRDTGAQVLVPLPYGPGVPDFAPGDEVVLGGIPDAPLESRYEVLDFQRTTPLLLLAVLFSLAVVALSRWRGVAALVGLGLSVVVLATFVLPALLAGESPLAVAVVGSSAIMIITLYLSHGISVRTSVALLGTLISLTLTGLLGAYFTQAARFAGLADESSAYLGSLESDIDIRGLLLAGLVIGALGVLDDVTVTQTAAVWEIARADPDASRRRLVTAGLRVGRDHVAATVNTLVLAYAGAALPVLLLFAVAGQGVVDTVTTELVAQEVVRALVGGLGIVAAVPVTTVLAALAVRERTRRRGRRVRGIAAEP